LALGEERGARQGAAQATGRARPRTARPAHLPVPRASAAELQAHEAMLDKIAKASDGRCLFRAG
jgi:hypothetical protein